MKIHNKAELPYQIYCKYTTSICWKFPLKKYPGSLLSSLRTKLTKSLLRSLVYCQLSYTVNAPNIRWIFGLETPSVWTPQQATSAPLRSSFRVKHLDELTQTGAVVEWLKENYRHAPAWILYVLSHNSSLFWTHCPLSECICSLSRFGLCFCSSQIFSPRLYIQISSK